VERNTASSKPFALQAGRQSKPGLLQLGLRRGGSRLQRAIGPASWRWLPPVCAVLLKTKSFTSGEQGQGFLESPGPGLRLFCSDDPANEMPAVSRRKIVKTVPRLSIPSEGFRERLSDVPVDSGV